MNWRKYTAFLRRKPVEEPKRVHRPKYKAKWEKERDRAVDLELEAVALKIKIAELEALVRKVEQPF